MIIVIDTREQRPWSFPPDIVTEIGTLHTGDYAIKGDDHFAVERKSGDDFVGTVSVGWHRFCKELNRMNDAGFVAKVVVVEADFETFCYRLRQGEIIPPDHEHVRCTPQFLMKRIAELTMLNVSVIFAGSADYASAVALRLFFERQKQLEKENTQMKKNNTNLAVTSTAKPHGLTKIGGSHEIAVQPEGRGGSNADSAAI